MNTSFAQLKKSSSSKLSKLNEELVKATTKQTPQTDERMWYPEVDKAGNGYAVIRFLPESKGEELPFVRRYNHAFQRDPINATGPWFVDNCPTTLGKKCPVCEHNQALWAEGQKNVVSKTKRQLSFYSNILVVEDTATPENKGKVFIFRYGKKIFDKLQEAMNPIAEGEVGYDPDVKPINPFDPWSGANFKLKIGKVDGRRNYDKSSFANPSPLGTDKEIEAIWEKQYPLLPFIAESEFKSYDELKTKLSNVLGGDSRKVENEKPAKASHAAVKHNHSADDDEDTETLAALQQLADADD